MSEPSMSRLLAELAAAAGELAVKNDQASAAVAKRDAIAVRAQAAGATYAQLADATVLSDMGVTKMLRRGRLRP